MEFRTLAFARSLCRRAKAEIIEYRTGAEPTASHKLPGLMHYENLVLKRGVTSSRDLFDWWKKIVDGIGDRRNVAISLLDDQRNVVKRWVIRDAWPCGYALSPLVSQDEATALIETVKLAAEGFDLS